eukprot:scaffold16232_cov126-Isochrysis_galbana.AAC.6
MLCRSATNCSVFELRKYRYAGRRSPDAVRASSRWRCGAVALFVSTIGHNIGGAVLGRICMY